MTTNQANQANQIILPLITNTNNIDLEYLINPTIYEKYVEQNNNINKEEFNTDKKFYKKRIISTVKSLLKSQEPNDYHEEIKTSFDAFIKNCIQYYKFIDTSDIIQNDYVEYSNNTNNQHNQNNTKLLSEENINNITTQLLKNKDLTKIMTMDDFVEKKEVEIKQIILPQERKINIKEKTHKKKRKKK